jgi:hypothetical protein
MKKITMITSILTLLFLSSCNKNIRVKKQIDGEWNIDAAYIVKESGGTVTYDESFFNFGTFTFNHDNSKGVLDTEIGSFEITNYYLTYDGTILNIEYDSSGDNVLYSVSDYEKKSKMTLTTESTSQGVKTTIIYSLTKK